MTNKEIERMVRLKAQEEVWNLLRLFSGDYEPFIMNGWNGAGPMVFEVCGIRVEIDIAVRST